MIHVFVADDHAIFRQGLRDMIRTTDGFALAGEASDGRAVLDAIKEGGIDVLVLDLSLPKVSGMEVLHRVRTERPELPIVVLSMYPEDQYAMRVLKEGAFAYLSKDRPSDELITAIREAVAGRRFISPPVAELALREATSTGRPLHEALSAREHQVFTLLYQGLSVAEIAAELDVTSGTVSNHVAAVKTKLNARTIADIVRYAARAGLCD